MIDLPIGSTFNDKGTILQVVPCSNKGLCYGCYYQWREFGHDKKRPWVVVDLGLHCHRNLIAAGVCLALYRDDGQNVIFQRCV